MKKIFFIVLLLAGSLTANAQKFGYVDSQYILSKIPEYKVAQDQLNQLSIGWQKEIEAKYSEIDQLYKAYKADEVLLTEEMKQKRQSEIEQKEQEVKDLQKQRFGVNGDLFKKRQELVKPLQDKIYNAVQALAERENLAVIFDKSSDLTMLYTNIKYDKSDEILKDLGYSTGNNGSGTNKSNNK
ncbi:MAG TPA: OmpH family outer membrane protein [Bacteroidia bacterium]|nr:OmpH family outer membrane protein [Bacteroidia bacterium]